MRTGPKPRERHGGSRDKSSGRRGRQSTSVKFGGVVVSSVGDGRALRGSYSDDNGREPHGVRTAAAGSLENGGVNGRGGGGAGWRWCLVGRSRGVGAVTSNVRRVPPVAVGQAEKRHGEVSRVVVTDSFRREQRQQALHTVQGRRTWPCLHKLTQNSKCNQ